MDNTTLRPEADAEQVIKAIFRSRGFKRFYPPRFEDYSLYSRNRSFFSGGGLASFTAPGGRLLALKPDITLSVANAVAEGSAAKLYYCDEVCRLSRDGGEYQSIRQLGMEIIGSTDHLADAELVDTALECLSSLGQGWALDVSHIGFVHALLNEAGLPSEAYCKALGALHTKSPHLIPSILDEYGIPTEKGGKIMALSRISGSLPNALTKAAALANCPASAAAVQELKGLSAALGKGAADVNLDFSVIGDVDYYNGIILKGYIAGVPEAVLSGGRYDRLMERLGKNQRAAGFAVSLSLLEQRFTPPDADAADILCLYGDDCDLAMLLEWQKSMRRQNKIVALRRHSGDSAPGRELWRACKNGIIKEDASC